MIVIERSRALCDKFMEFSRGYDAHNTLASNDEPSSYNDV